MEKHTPGPWTYYYSGGSHFVRQGRSKHGPWHQEVSAHTEADARLIASAPDLLGALQELVCCPAFTGDLFERDKESHRAWTLAREAIRKAEEG